MMLRSLTLPARVLAGAVAGALCGALIGSVSVVLDELDQTLMSHQMRAWIDSLPDYIDDRLEGE